MAEEDDEVEMYRKRMMLAYKYRPNPLVWFLCLVSLSFHSPFPRRIILGDHTKDKKSRNDFPLPLLYKKRCVGLYFWFKKKCVGLCFWFIRCCEIQVMPLSTHTSWPPYPQVVESSAFLCPRRSNWCSAWFLQTQPYKMRTES